MKSVLTETLQKLYNYSKKIDDGNITEKSLTIYENMEDQIIDAYKAGELERGEYIGIWSLYYTVKIRFHHALGHGKATHI